MTATNAPVAAEQDALLDQIIWEEHLNNDEKIARLQSLRPKPKAALQQVTLNGVADLSPDQKLELITTNLQETLNIEIIEKIVREQNRPPSVYWGAPY